MSKAPESLTPYERQTLINQFAILERLDPDNADDYREKQKILRQGYSIQYGMVFETWGEKSIEECRYVYDVLDMYRILKFSYKSLSPEEKATIKEEDLEFEGFDGNNESERHGFVEHLQEQGKWRETLIEGRSFDSHSMRTIGLYPPMLEVFKHIRESKGMGRFEFTAAEIKEVLETTR